MQTILIIIVTIIFAYFYIKKTQDIERIKKEFYKMGIDIEDDERYENENENISFKKWKETYGLSTGDILKGKKNN